VDAFEHHLTSPQGHGRLPAGAHTVEIGGGSCCDRIGFSLAIDGRRVTDAGFTADGCGAATAAGSAAVTLARERTILDAARIGAREIADELGGLSPGKLHAAELAADALARALGQATRAHGALRHDRPRTLVAMSGGVDSAVAALLTARTSEAVAVTLELWADHENDAERSCCSASAVAGARALAHRMGLPHFTLDLRQEFRAGVVEPFIAGHRAGETPNPCVGCNGHVRLDAMLAFADRLGCANLATGHYARIAEEFDPRGPLLRRAVDAAKDQSYMLAALGPGTLARLRFPLGEIPSKHEVRRIAAQAALPVAAKRDSQDLCFLAGTTRERFLARHGGLADEPGDIVGANGRTLGRHRGQHHYTIGQRRGLPLATGEPLYVLDKDPATRRVYVGPGAALGTCEVPLRDVRLYREAERVNRVKLRYRQNPLAARLHAETLALQLAEPAEGGAAPGQLACLMDGDLVVGWGTIARRPPRRSLLHSGP
jgi:tRNA-specific 2-thiouridylase